MKKIITITPSWQIHIPISLRKQLELTKPVQATAEVKEGKLIITPKESGIIHFAGKFKKYYQRDKKKIDLANIRDYIDYSQL